MPAGSQSPHSTMISWRLLSGMTQRRGVGDGGQGPRERFAVRIGQRGDTGIGDRIGRRFWRDTAGERRRNHFSSDPMIVAEAALEGVAIAFDQPRGLGYFARKIEADRRSGADMGEPTLDFGLLFSIAISVH